VGHSSLGERQIATHDVAFVRRQPTISNRQWPTWFIKPLAAQEAEGISVPLVEQNARMSLEIADIAYVLYDGIVKEYLLPPVATEEQHLTLLKVSLLSFLMEEICFFC
jgi:hypothetical protein